MMMVVFMVVLWFSVCAIFPHDTWSQLEGVNLADTDVMIIYEIDLMQPGNTVILRNEKIDMFKGSMRPLNLWSKRTIIFP
ncbi:hypothetical protein F511_03026 [Dorcoceras hygrometricum]|nr:hypothetical protein F511_03026 [Dorcoceras hygrometricum]